MKRRTIVYWGTTGLAALALAGGGIGQVSRSPEMVANMVKLGYPAYFMVILGTWKLLAALALVVPGAPRLKEWAYAGLTFLLTGAFVSHLAAGDPLGNSVAPLAILAVVLVSSATRPDSRKLVAR